MARKSILTDLFVAKIHAELKKPNATMHTVARKLRCSPSTIYRATGGKGRLDSGKTTAWVASAKRVKAQRRSHRNSVSRAKPHGNAKRKLKPRAA
jgi:hypothetical protein